MRLVGAHRASLVVASLERVFGVEAEFAVLLLPGVVGTRQTGFPWRQGAKG